jgi:phage tail P2-like protein
MTNGITAEAVLAALPEVLRSDVSTQGLASAIAAELEEAACKTNLATIYANIESLDEPLLDILAKDFKVDWWRGDASVGEKRQTLKDSPYVHRHLGTKAAVERAISDFLGTGVLQEWWEYGGKPYHFRIHDGNNAAIQAHVSEFLSVLRVVQRGSAVLDKISALVSLIHMIYICFAIRIRKTGAVGCDTEVRSVTILADPLGNYLADPAGNILIL